MHAIVESLDRAIREGKYPPHERLPSERELARRFEVPLATARAALKTLVDRGMVHRIPRGGTFASISPPEAAPDEDRFALHCVNFVEPVRKRTDPFAFALADTLHGYTRALQQHPLRVRFLTLPLEETRFEAVLNPALPVEGQGCIIGDLLYPQLMEWLNERDVPYVIRRHSVYDPRDYPPHVGVYLNRNGASSKATLDLMALGHRRIGFIGQLRDDSRGSTWALDWTSHHEGYRAAFCMAGLPLRGDYEVDILGDSMENAASAVTGVLQLPDRPTAIVCQNDLTAFGVIEAAKALGLDVPRDLSVIGFDNDPAGAESAPPLTTFGGHEELAVTAIETLFELAEGRGPGPGAKPVECPLIERGSVAAWVAKTQIGDR